MSLPFCPWACLRTCQRWVVVAGAGVSAATWATPQTGLVGSWRLVRYADSPEGGPPVYAFGEHPIGLFVFTADGHVSITLMRNPPDPDTPATDPDPDACIPSWYCAYFGTYSVDLKKQQWITHVQGSNIPSYLGTDQPRSFTMSGDRLIIHESYMAEGKRVNAERVLERERK